MTTTYLVDHFWWVDDNYEELQTDSPLVFPSKELSEAYLDRIHAMLLDGLGDGIEGLYRINGETGCEFRELSPVNRYSEKWMIMIVKQVDSTDDLDKIEPC